MAKLTPEQFAQKMKRWERRFPDAVYSGLEKGAQAVVARSVKSYLRGPAPERIRVDTGRLWRSITYRMRRAPRIMASVGTNVPYGRVWEGGRRRKRGGLDKRPFLRPAIEQERRRVLEFVAEAVTGAYKRG